jgi:hypothetical protein
MTITSFIKKILEAGSATVQELVCRAEQDPDWKAIMDAKRRPTHVFASILHQGDIQRNPRGWCQSEWGRPLRYSLVKKTVEKPAAGSSPTGWLTCHQNLRPVRRLTTRMLIDGIWHRTGKSHKEFNFWR